ncbi:MAG TPA: hypothetical protein VFV19_18965 [Candidatus Polarisedimenticolaceae bacterium]|nr:hypothetical protein [Candidatus Polarisedimenticolaceae bacterium]
MSTAIEFEWLSTAYPSLPLFVQPIDAQIDRHWKAVLNTRPACYFLTHEGKCELHAIHGRHRKPLNCRLFPANQFTRSGDILVVGLSTLCPIRLWDDASNDFRIMHADLRSDVAEASDEIALLATILPPGPDGPRLTDELVDGEEWLRDQVFARAGLGLFDYVAVERVCASRGYSLWPDPHECGVQREWATRTFSDTLEFLGASSFINVEHLAAERLIVAFAPRLRIKALSAGRPSAATSKLLGFSSRLILAVAAYIELIAATNRCSISFSTIDDAIRANLPLLLMIAHLDDVPVLADRERARRLNDHAVDEIKCLSKAICDASGANGATLRTVLADLVIQKTDRLRLLRGLTELEPEISWEER